MQKAATLPLWWKVLLSGSPRNIDVSAQVLVFFQCPWTDVISDQPIIPFDTCHALTSPYFNLL